MDIATILDVFREQFPTDSNLKTFFECHEIDPNHYGRPITALWHAMKQLRLRSESEINPPTTEEFFSMVGGLITSLHPDASEYHYSLFDAIDDFFSKLDLQLQDNQVGRSYLKDRFYNTSNQGTHSQLKVFLQAAWK